MRKFATAALLSLAACLPKPYATPDAGVQSPCGTCGVDEYCDVVVRPPVCKPRGDRFCPCKADEYCDVNVDPPTCKSVCTQKKSDCPAPTVCDTQERKCVNPTCNGVQCAAGEGCYDPASLTTGDLVSNTDVAVCTCAPTLTSTATGEEVQRDTCSDAGMVCDLADLNNPTPSRCRLPRQFEYCLKAVGCEGGAAGSLECMTSPFDGDAGLNRCFAKCTSTAECPDPDMKCWPNTAQFPAALRLHCFYNYCAESQYGTTDAAQFFRPCPATTSTDGQCIPINLSDGTSMGLCRQTGTVASGQECDPNAQRPNLAAMCPAGEYCEPVQPGTSPGTVRGICRTLCNGAPEGSARKPDLNCATGKICTDETTSTPSYQSGDLLADDARLGFCRDQCDLLYSADTCGQDVLTNEEACYYNYGGHTDVVGACRPMLPDAPGSGADCLVLSDDDHRASCADRLLCAVNVDFKCHKMCDLTVCSNSTVACAQCDAGQKCIREGEQDPPPVKVGFCK